MTLPNTDPIATAAIMPVSLFICSPRSAAAWSGPAAVRQLSANVADIGLAAKPAVWQSVAGEVLPMTRPTGHDALLPALAVIFGALACGAVASGQDGNGRAPEVWTFDRLDRLGGHPTTVLGNPRIVQTPIGKAAEFDGIDDALFVDVHPLEGATTFTWEAIFRPDGGDREQRWFHLQETGSEHRMLFEIRVAGDQWFLDSYIFSATGSATLMNKSSLHPLGAWYHVAAVYDGKVFRNYVNGVQDGAATVELAPQGPGRSSAGVRINLVNYFKGAIHSARFTRRALSPGEFLGVPGR
jgi:hypothetical protein